MAWYTLSAEMEMRIYAQRTAKMQTEKRRATAGQRGYVLSTITCCDVLNLWNGCSIASQSKFRRTQERDLFFHHCKNVHYFLCCWSWSTGVPLRSQPLESQIAPLTGLGEICSLHFSSQRTMVLLVLWGGLLGCVSFWEEWARELDTLGDFGLITSPLVHNLVGAFPKLGCDCLHTCLFCSTDSECWHQRLYPIHFFSNRVA